MKILFISNDPLIFNPTSAERARMRAYAVAIGEVHILSAAPSGATAVSEGGLHLYPIHAPRIFRTHVLAKRAHALILSQGIEVVSAQDPFEHGLAALRAARGTGARLHIQVHTDFLSPWFVKSGTMRSSRAHAPVINRLRRRWADRALPAAAGIRVVSERVKASLIARYGNRIPVPSVIPILVDSIVPVPVPLPAHPFTFALITVGRLEPEKRIEDILAALKLVLVHYPMVGLFIVGSGREEVRLKRLAHTLGLANKVIFLGNRTDARGLMGSAHAFVQASAYEGYGRTLIEAALAKVPIITTDVGIVGEVFKGYEDVLSAPVADPTALSLHIVGILEDENVRVELPIHAEATARAHLLSKGDLATRVAADLAQALQHS